jgi:hypothetical protein
MAFRGQKEGERERERAKPKGTRGNASNAGTSIDRLLCVLHVRSIDAKEHANYIVVTNFLLPT